MNWYINPITSISWLLIYLQAENELENISNNNRSVIKKRRLSNSAILQSSILTNVHRSKDFLQTFLLAVRVSYKSRISSSYPLPVQISATRIKGQ